MTVGGPSEGGGALHYQHTVKSSESFLQEGFLKQLNIVTGTLLTSPSNQGLNRRLGWIIPTHKVLYGWLYQLTLDEVKQRREQEAKEGTDVRLILENERYQQYHNDFNTLRDEWLGTDIGLQSDYKMGVNYTHAKTFITDTLSIIQTANLTHSSFFKNREHFFITSNTEVRESLLSLFTQDREGNHIDVESIYPNLLICPVDCKSKLLALLSAANASIKMYQQYISDDDVLQLLQQKVREGIIVTIRLPDKPNNHLTQQHFPSGVILLQTDPYIHSKTILVDDTYLLIGSMNMSTNSLERNREIGIITMDTGVIKAWKQ